MVACLSRASTSTTPTGNWLTEGLEIETPPDVRFIRYLAVRWKLARAVVIRPTDAGWLVLHVGCEVRVALAASWWPF